MKKPRVVIDLINDSGVFQAEYTIYNSQNRVILKTNGSTANYVGKVESHLLLGVLRSTIDFFFKLGFDVNLFVDQTDGKEIEYVRARDARAIYVSQEKDENHSS